MNIEQWIHLQLKSRKKSKRKLLNRLISRSKTKQNLTSNLVKKERKDNLGLQIGLDIIDRLDLPVKNEVQEDFNPDIAVKKEAPASHCFVQGIKVAF